MKFNLGLKLLVGFSCVIIVIIFLVGFNYFSLKNLSKKQDAGATRADDALLLEEAVGMPMKVYSVIADLIINKNYDENRKQFNDVSKELIDDIANIEKISDTDEEKQLVKDAKKVAEGYIGDYELTLGLVKKNDLAAIEKQDEDFDRMKAEIQADFSKIRDSIYNEMKEGDKVFDITINNIIMISLILAVISILIALMVTFIMTRSISTPIKIITEGAERLAVGDIDLVGMDWNQINKIINRSDELGNIGRAFSKLIEYNKEKVNISENIANGNIDVKVNISSDADKLGIAFSQTIKSLNEILGQVNISVEQVNTGALQVSSASQELSQGATEQASSLEEITSSVTEINSQSKQNTEGAMQASEMAKQAMEGASLGNKQMQELVLAMQDISKSAESISKISKTIDDIAFQINLLALNANVEAARAGKYGKGFAVVAEEVRNLAARSAGSVKETTALIEEAAKNIEKGNKFVESTAKKIEGFVEIASKVKEIADNVSLSSKEQTQGLDQINIGLGQIDQVTQSNTASAEECASAAEELASQAEILKFLVAKFRLSGANEKNEDAKKPVKEQIKIEHLKQNKQMNNQQTKKIDTKKIISLDDNNFGKF